MVSEVLQLPTLIGRATYFRTYWNPCLMREKPQLKLTFKTTVLWIPHRLTLVPLASASNLWKA